MALHVGGDDFAAALAATLAGARTVLAVGANDPARIERLRAALVGQGR
jgi:thiamine monophosphate synthase